MVTNILSENSKAVILLALAAFGWGIRASEAAALKMMG